MLFLAFLQSLLSVSFCNSVCYAGNMFPWHEAPTRNFSKVRSLIQCNFLYCSFRYAIFTKALSKRALNLMVSFNGWLWESWKARNDFNFCQCPRFMTDVTVRMLLKKLHYFGIFLLTYSDASFLFKSNQSDYTIQDWISRLSSSKVSFKICLVNFISNNFHFHYRLISSNQ